MNWNLNIYKDPTLRYWKIKKKPEFDLKY